MRPKGKRYSVGALMDNFLCAVPVQKYYGEWWFLGQELTIIVDKGAILYPFIVS